MTIIEASALSSQLSVFKLSEVEEEKVVVGTPSVFTMDTNLKWVDLAFFIIPTTDKRSDLQLGFVWV